MKRSYMVVYERAAEDNWGAWVPDVGGAVGAGDTLDLARQNVREGIAIQLEYLAEQGTAAPQAISMGVDFSEFDTNPANSHYEIEWMAVDLPEVPAHAAEEHAKQAA